MFSLAMCCPEFNPRMGCWVLLFTPHPGLADISEKQVCSRAREIAPVLSSGCSHRSHGKGVRVPGHRFPEPHWELSREQYSMAAFPLLTVELAVQHQKREIHFSTTYGFCMFPSKHWFHQISLTSAHGVMNTVGFSCLGKHRGAVARRGTSEHMKLPGQPWGSCRDPVQLCLVLP